MRVARDDIHLFFQFGLSIPTRTIYLGEVSTDAGAGYYDSPGVDYRLADHVIKGIHILEARSKEEEIHVLLNNPGGDEYQGLAIYDAIRMCPCHVTIRVLGHAMSMASWILQAGDTRELLPSSTIMLHYGSWSYHGHALDFQKWAKENERLVALMEDHYLDRIREKHARFTRERLRHMIQFDKIIAAPEAVELGLADKVFEYPSRS